MCFSLYNLRCVILVGPANQCHKQMSTSAEAFWGSLCGGVSSRPVEQGRLLGFLWAIWLHLNEVIFRVRRLQRMASSTMWKVLYISGLVDVKRDMSVHIE